MLSPFKNSMKADINSIENVVDLDQLAADQGPHCFPNNTRVHNNY